MSSKAAVSSNRRGSSTNPGPANTPAPSTTTLASVSNTMTTPSSGTFTSDEDSDPHRPSRRHKTARLLLKGMKDSLYRLSDRMGQIANVVGELTDITEQLDDIVRDSELHEDYNETEASSPGALIHKITPLEVRLLRQKSLNVLLATHLNLDPVPSLDTLGLKAATLKNLVDDGVLNRTHELYLPKAILRPLISGENVILQLRGPLLDDNVSYTLVDIIDQAKPELCVVIIVNHIKNRSTKCLLMILEKKLKVGKISTDLLRIGKESDLSQASEVIQDVPRIYVTTPDMLPSVKDANLLHPDHTRAIVLFRMENEICVPLKSNAVAMTSVLEKMKRAQFILAVDKITEACLWPKEVFGFQKPPIVYSLDHEHCKNASLFYYHGPSMEDAILDRAAELSKKYPVVILGDAADIPRLKEALSTKARLIQNDEVLGPHMFPHGIFVALYDSKMFFLGKPRTGVKLVIDVAQFPFTMEGYFNAMAMYMDVGESCNIAVKLTSFRVIPDLKSMNPNASEITDADTIPF